MADIKNLLAEETGRFKNFIAAEIQEIELGAKALVGMIYDQIRNLGLCVLLYCLWLWFTGALEVLSSDVIMAGVLLWILWQVFGVIVFKYLRHRKKAHPVQ